MVRDRVTDRVRDRSRVTVSRLDLTTFFFYLSKITSN